MKIARKLYLLIILTAISINILHAQSEDGRLSFGINMGGVKYWGEFTDNQFWWAGDLYLRYNILPYLSLHTSAGLAQMRYKTDDAVLKKYPEYFGADAKKGQEYPNSYQGKPIIEDKNAVRINTYEAFLSFNFFPTQSFVPYAFAGVGLMNWEPKAGETGGGGSLPNNLNKKYDKQKLIIPVGIGFEAYITDDLTFNGRGTFRFTGTDYLDDFKKDGSDNDAFLTFGVGLSYYILGDADYDKDGLTNNYEREIGCDPKNPDSDGDGLNDGEEVMFFYTNPLKPDTDGDNLLDYDEIYTHKTSPVKADSDSDKLNDGEEIARKTNPTLADTDDDRLLDGEEINTYYTDPLNKDTDDDGLIDGDEVLKYSTNPKANDTDGDGLGDGEEVLNYKTNPLVADTDSDGLNDGLEIRTYKTDANNPDTDSDMLLDGEEVSNYKSNPLSADSDSDSLNDGEEVKKFNTNPILADSDRDGLNDGDEINKYKTNPLAMDTDKEGLNDGDEVLKYKTNPLLMDTDKDLINDFDEVTKYKTNPILADTDGDKLDDGTEINKTNTDPNNPDTDGDTVQDGEDDCPLIAGVVSTEKGKNGCPEPPKIGTKTDFPDILFVVNTDNFDFDNPATVRNLNKLLDYVNQCEGLQIKIEGHASEEGNKKRNQELSDMRAKKVKQWLFEQGVKPEKIGAAIGYGSSKPKIKEPVGKELKAMKKEDLEKIRKQNRRITVEVAKTCD